MASPYRCRAWFRNALRGHGPLRTPQDPELTHIDASQRYHVILLSLAMISWPQPARRSPSTIGAKLTPAAPPIARASGPALATYRRDVFCQLMARSSASDLAPLVPGTAALASAAASAPQRVAQSHCRRRWSLRSPQSRVETDLAPVGMPSGIAPTSRRPTVPRWLRAPHRRRNARCSLDPSQRGDLVQQPVVARGLVAGLLGQFGMREESSMPTR